MKWNEKIVNEKKRVTINELQTYGGEQVKAIYISIRNKNLYEHIRITHVSCRRITCTKCLEYLLICDLFYLYVNINRKKCANSTKKTDREVCEWVNECVRKWVSEKAREYLLCVSVHFPFTFTFTFFFVHDSHYFGLLILFLIFVCSYFFLSHHALIK